MLPRGDNVYQVREVTQMLQDLLQSEPTLRDLWIEGEISNFARPVSGHVYFTLKDNRSRIRCAIFRGSASRLRFPLKNGDAVLVHGRLDIYGARSEYQIIGDRVVPAGEGDLQVALERLKEQLGAEGLFDSAHKKPLPEFPRKIGLITSATGAAIRDMLRMLQKRYPVVEALLFPTLVQGHDAGLEIAHAIECMNSLPDIDLLIVGRGGGSVEDLWAFNEEIVARAIFKSRIPVVSAVGHEKDVTIADLVADQRAPTPSAAIEYTVPDQQELRRRIATLESDLAQRIAGRVDDARTRLASAYNRISPSRQLDNLHRLQQMTDHLDSRIRQGVQKQMRMKAQACEIATSRLGALNPLATLARGYSVCRDSSGRTLTDASNVQVGDEIEVQLSRGRLTCHVLRGETDG